MAFPTKRPKSKPLSLWLQNPGDMLIGRFAPLGKVVELRRLLKNISYRSAGALLFINLKKLWKIYLVDPVLAFSLRGFPSGKSSRHQKHRRLRRILNGARASRPMPLS